MGVITRNETICHNYDNYEVKLAYSDQVDGKEYSGDRYIYNAAMFGKTTGIGLFRKMDITRFT
jgi:hypothetical protein